MARKAIAPVSAPRSPILILNPLDLEDDHGVDDEQDREEDRGPVEVLRAHRSAAERAAATPDAEGAGEPRVLARVQEHEEYERGRDDHLHDSEDRVHGPA